MWWPGVFESERFVSTGRNKKTGRSVAKSKTIAYLCAIFTVKEVEAFYREFYNDV